MAKFCHSCGAQLEDGAGFCFNCGARQVADQPAQPAPQQTYAQPAPQPQAAPAYQQPAAPAYQQPAYQQPYAAPRQPVYQPAAPVKTKKKGGAGKVVASVICLVLAAAILVGCFWKPGFLVNASSGSGKSGTSIFNPSGGGKTGKAVTVTAEDPVAETESGVTVELSPFLFDYDEELPVTVTSKGSETLYDGVCRVTSYDVNVGDLKELGTYIDIRIPYDGTMCDPGEDPAECVGAKYYNEETGEWEDVLYDVDAENMEVVIHTDHLSTYGCFEVSSAGYRKALITGIEEWATGYYVDLDTAKKALTEFAQGGGGEACQSIGMQVLADVCNGTVEKAGIVGDQLDYVSNTYGGLQLGDIQFFSDQNNTINKAIGDTLTNLGRILGAVKLTAEIAKPGKTDEDIISIYKDAGMYALSFAKGGLSTAMVGVWMIDKSLTEFGNAAKNIRMENWETIYEYYNDKWQGSSNPGDYGERARTTAEWRDLVSKCIQASHGDQETFNALLEAQVDAYARRFFNNPPEDAIAEIVPIVEHNWNGALSKNEKEEVISKYKEKLYSRLTSVVMKELQNDYERQLQSEFMKELNHLKDVLNSVSEVHVYEELDDEHSEYQYGNYKLRFGDLNSTAVVKSWTGKFGKEPDLRFNVSMIGWIISGQPDRIDFWAPDKDPDTDKPEFSVDFDLDFPSCEVPITSNCPTFEEVCGFYDSGILTVTDVYIPPEIKEAMEQASQSGESDGDGDGCDFDFDFDLEALVGETREVPFSIEAVGDMIANIGGDGLGEIFSTSGGMPYNEKTGKFSEVTFTIAEDDEEYTVTVSMSAVYSDENKSGVVVAGPIKITMISGFIPGLVMSFSLAGEKPLP
ncbi:MAG: zinc ribbon domain-containing protein [Oscillospiraceae bacterium]|nr:zinc ribbon domain-containing protein [Oscillospiraceae bacterium]